VGITRQDAVKAAAIIKTMIVPEEGQSSFERL